MKVLFLLSFSLFGFMLSKGQTVTVDPNPFVKRTLVSYTLTDTDTVSIDIYNRWGAGIIALKTNSIMPAGIYMDSLMMESFEDNIYVLVLKNKRKNLVNKQVVKSASSGIGEIIHGPAVNIYPNPVKTLLNVDFDPTGTFGNELTISNSLGQIVYYGETRSDRQEIDLSCLPAGIYFLHAEKGPGQRVYKIVKE